MKKITISLAVLLTGLVANSYAALPSGNSKFDVKVPCYKGGLTFGLAGLYLKPSEPELDYAVTFPAADNLNLGQYHSVDFDYNWGYKVSLGYLFPCSGNDVQLTYTSYNNSEKSHLDSSTIHGTTSFFSSFTDDDITFVTTSAVAKAKNSYQAVDLDGGQHINIGCNTAVRLFGGLRYVDLESRFNADYFGDLDINEDAVIDHVSLFTSQKTRFKGVGPRLGMDINYNLGQGFGVVGQLASALIIGNSNSFYSAVAHVVDNTGATVVDDSLSYHLPNQTRVVPNASAKLGLDYSYQFCNPSRTKLTVEAGYMTDYFFNSTDRLNLEAGVTPENRTRHVVDTSFSGPYVGIQVNL